MTKTVLLGISIASILSVGMLFAPILAQDDVGGGDPPKIKRTWIHGESDDKIKRVIIKTNKFIPNDGQRGWIGLGFFTDVTRNTDSGDQSLVFVATQHGDNGEGFAFYDNMGQGRAPLPGGSLAEIASPANGGALKIKVLCTAEDLMNSDCGNEWHIHHAWVGATGECESGVEVKSLSYSQPGRIAFLGKVMVISDVAKDPHRLINSLGDPAVDEFDDYSFGELTDPIAFGISGAVDAGGAPHACVNPI